MTPLPDRLAQLTTSMGRAVAARLRQNWHVLCLSKAMRHAALQGVVLALFIGMAAGCGSSGDRSSGSGSDAASGTQASTATNTTTSSNNTSSSSAMASTAAASTGGNDTNGSGGGSSSLTTATTSVGGGAGNTNATSNATTGGGGGSGGDAGEACPNEPPRANTPCPGLGLHCAYEDCDGAGRSVAQCTQGTWFVDTAACGETVYCNGGSETCAPGEVCLILSGGAFLEECVPNTCEDEAVECGCIEGCFGDCPVYAYAESGITITCNTCPSGMCP